MPFQTSNACTMLVSIRLGKKELPQGIDIL
jgi:hypothetical protein